MIYILAGDIRTGKTTAVLNWANQRDDVDGWLCPDNENGKRCFLNVKSKVEYELEIESEVESTKVVSIGPFNFLRPAFKKANDYLISLTSENKRQYIIIDELGRLELNKEGLHTAAEDLIPKFLDEDTEHLILVVRNYLLDEIIEHYDISEYRILKKEDLKSLL
ncbi:nucleoside-triphosphatase [Psychroserpens sp.]|jgi:nucleoside-triphosphatase THEP1|uniref:nucleoside-triphosphatase n=1 Tax=Psychroserpens sp. TaxID=2020870 RepID=UPI0039E39190